MKDCKLAVIAYVFGFVSGIFVLYTQKDNKFLRYSAAQSLVFSLLFLFLYLVLRAIPFVGNILSLCVAFLFFVLWVVLICKAYQNTYLKLPFISDISEKLEKIL